MVAQERALGAERLIGVYRPTSKNGMVREHYQKLGFTQIGKDGGNTEWVLSLNDWTERPTAIVSEPAAG